MFADTLTIKNAAAVDQTFNKVQSKPDGCVYAHNGNTATDKVMLTIKYQPAGNLRYTTPDGAGGAIKYDRKLRRALIQVTHTLYDADSGKVLQGTVNETVTYIEDMTGITRAFLNDMHAYAGNFIMATANADKVYRQEA